MKRFSDYRNLDLQLVQPSQMKRDCELISPDGIILKAYFPSWRKSDAVVDGFGGKWIIKKPSIWKSAIEVSKDGFNYPIASYTGKAFKSGGTIQLQRGLLLPFESNVFKSVYTIFTDTNEILLQIKQTGLLKKKTDVTLGKRKLEILDEYPWLPMLIWYVMLNNQRQSIAGVHYS
jgi:hypothetical protein